MEIFCDCEPPSKYYMPKLLTLDKEDNVMIYVCPYSHRSYIVKDPSTCSAWPPSLLVSLPRINRTLIIHANVYAQDQGLTGRYHNTTLDTN